MSLPDRLTSANAAAVQRTRPTANPRWRWTRRWLLLPLILALLMLALIAAALQRTPLVARGETIAPEAIAEAKRLLRHNDPRRLQSGEVRTAEIPATLIDEGINYLASRRLHGRGAFAMAEDNAEVRLTLGVPLGIAVAYLNFRATVREAAGEPRIAAATVGDLRLPAAAAEWLLDVALTRFGVAEQWQNARRAIRQIAFEPASGLVGVTYVWESGLFDQARTLAFTPAEIAEIKAAHLALAGLLDHYAPGGRMPLARVLPPFLNAVEATPRARRAALLVLASQLAEKNLALLIPAARHWPRVRWLKLTLQGRNDSAQHFVVSAALAAWAGEPAANAIGLYKEIDDSRGGSGFSFADLAADRAGTRFGERLIGDSSRVDAALAGALTDGDLLPPLAALPEGFSSTEFKAHFGDRDSPAYRRLSDEIERRLDELPLYR